MKKGSLTCIKTLKMYSLIELMNYFILKSRGIHFIYGKCYMMVIFIEIISKSGDIHFYFYY